jgi:hypothetical protein
MNLKERINADFMTAFKSKEMEKVNATFPYDGDNVYTMFKWEKTAQGHDYWSRIASKLDNANV